MYMKSQMQCLLSAKAQCDMCTSTAWSKPQLAINIMLPMSTLLSNARHCVACSSAWNCCRCAAAGSLFVRCWCSLSNKVWLFDACCWLHMPRSMLSAWLLNTATRSTPPWLSCIGTLADQPNRWKLHRMVQTVLQRVIPRVTSFVCPVVAIPLANVQNNKPKTA